MLRNRFRARTRLSTANLMFFFGGVIFCVGMQSLKKYTENEPRSASFHQTRNSVETVIAEIMVQGVKEKSCNLSAYSTDNEFSSQGLGRIDSQRRGKWRLVVVVLSAPTHIRTRRVIRETWALTRPENTVVYFAVGIDNLSDTTASLVKRENNIHADLLLLENFRESYRNLTQKLLETLKWVHKNLVVDYFMKVDEDSFVRLAEVVMALDSKPTENLYWGYFSGAAPVQKYGKWAESNYFLCDNFLPYAVGGGYVISSDLVHYLASNWNRLLIFINEDVSLGTWLAPLTINRIHDSSFNTESVSRGCFNSYLVSHPYTIFGLLSFNRSLRDTGKLCTKEWRYYNAYKYDWSVPPRYCCDRSNPAD